MAQMLMITVTYVSIVGAFRIDEIEVFVDIYIVLVYCALIPLCVNYLLCKMVLFVSTLIYNLLINK